MSAQSIVSPEYKAELLTRYVDLRNGQLWLKRANRPVSLNTDRHGYHRIFLRRHPRPSVCILAHRAIWFLHFGRWPNDEIDHINHIRTDNRIENLRDVSHSENARRRIHHRFGKRWQPASGEPAIAPKHGRLAPFTNGE